MAGEVAAHLATIGSRCSTPSRVSLAALGAAAPLTASARRDLAGRHRLDGSDYESLVLINNEGLNGGPPRRA